MLSPGQTIATCQHNISQRCWAQHIACVWPPCCNVLGVVGPSLKLVKFEPTTPNTSQYVATRRPNARSMLRPTMLRYVALACCDRLAGALNFPLSCNSLKCLLQAKKIIRENSAKKNLLLCKQTPPTTSFNWVFRYLSQSALGKLTNVTFVVIFARDC